MNILSRLFSGSLFCSKESQGINSPDELVSLPLHTIVEKQAALTPDAIAVCDSQREISYRELNEAANQCANMLVAHGAQIGEVIGLQMNRSVDAVIGSLAILKAGAACLPVQQQIPQSLHDYICADAGLKTILSRASGDKNPSHGVDVLEIESASTYKVSEPDLDRTVHVNDLAYVLYTSGTTGRPKGVDLPHRGLSNVVIYRVAHMLPDEKRVVFAATAPLSADGSIGQLFTPLCCGGKLVVIDNIFDMPKSEYFEQITLIGSTPSVIKFYIEHHALPPSLRVLFLGGENVESDLCEKIWAKTNVAKLINLYGPTETSVHSTYSVLFSREKITNSKDQLQLELPINIGKPIARTAIHILDDNLQPCPKGQSGTIHISGDGLARGYRNRDALTLEKFQQIPYGEGTIRAYDTGDIGLELDNGSFRFLGRSDRQVKLRGHRIELDEIELTLADIPGIRQCAVELLSGESFDAARAGTKQEDSIAAFVSFDNRSPEDQQRLRGIKKQLREKLPSYMLPTRYIEPDELPIARSGKIDRQAVLSRYTSGEA